MLNNYPTEILNNQEFTVFKGIAGAKLYLINTLSEWRSFFMLMNTKDLIACDTETTGFAWHGKDKVVGLSFGWDDTHCYVPLRHEESILGGKPPGQLDIDDIKADLVSFFSKKERTTLWWNAKFDMHFYKKEGINITAQVVDVMNLWHLYDENAPKKLKIVSSGWKDDMGRPQKGIVDPQANAKEKEIDLWRTKESKKRREAFRKLVMLKADELRNSIAHQDKNRNELKKWIAQNLLQNHPWATAGKEDIHYGIIPVALMCEYAALDTFLTYRVYEYCLKNMKFTNAVNALFKNETELVRVLFDAEQTGVHINSGHLQTAGWELDTLIKQLHESLKKELGEINLNSTLQLAESLLKNGVNLTKLTDSSTEEKPKYALDKKVLNKLKERHELVGEILQLREATKLKSTYVDGIVEKLTPQSTLHCSFNQNVSTGRMSSRDPNLQNIPAKDKIIRRAFVIPSDSYVYLLGDYSQVEVRLTAHFSQDPLLLDAYAKNQDIHTRSMCEMFDHEYDFAVKVLKDENNPMFAELDYLRTLTKRLVFGIIYGVGGPGLSEQISRPQRYIHLTEKEWIKVCQDYIDQYLDKYIGVKRFVNQSSRLVAKNKEVVNYFGRVRRLPHADACNIYGDKKFYWLEKRAQRQGVNHLVQSTAADIFKIACVRIHKLLQGTKSKLVSFVHDELHIYLHKDELYLLNPIKAAMEDWRFSVPIKVDLSWSKTNWAEKKKI